MHLTVIDRYLLRETLQTWAAVIAVLLLIVVTNTLVYMLGHVLEGRISGAALLPLFVTNMFSQILLSMIPVSLYLALLLVFGRLYAESEMAALNACGIGLRQLYRPVVMVALIGAVLSGALSIWIAPWAKQVEHDIELRLAAESELAGVAAGRFNRAAGDRVTLFAERRSGDGSLVGVFVEARDGDEPPVVIRAERAYERADVNTGHRFLELLDGVRYSGRPGSAEFQVIEFERHGLRMPDVEIRQGRLGVEARSTRELMRSDRLGDIAQLQWRLSFPLGCIVLALMALPLARTTPRSGRFSRIWLALLVYVVYANLMLIARDAIGDGTVPPAVGMWWAHAVSLAAIAALITHAVGWRWTRHVLAQRFQRFAGRS